MRSENFAGKLSKLRQLSTVLDYQREFQRLSNRVKGLSESYLISLYLSGLRDDIRVGAQKLNPTNLPDAFNFARLQEEESSLWRKWVWTENGKPNMGVVTNEPRPSVPAIKKLTPNEARERRERGLCYHCDERYTPNHHCKTQNLFWVEGLLQGGDDDGLLLAPCAPLEHNEMLEEEAPPQISLHAIAGTRAPQTMRVSGTLRHCKLTLLIDREWLSLI